MDFALILDIVVLTIVLVSAVVAFLRGFVREVLTIVGLVGAALMALTAGPALTPGILDWLVSDLPADADVEEARLWGYVPYDVAAAAIAYLGIFVITLITLSVISHFIAKSVHAVGLGPVDRSFGVVFGAARGFVLVGLLYLPFHILMKAEEKEDWFGTAHTLGYVEYSSELILSLMPESWSRADKEESDDDKADPLKDLTGENDEPALDIGTDEEAAEQQNSVGYDDIERQAIDALIENQDRIKSLLDSPRENGTPNE